MGVGGVKSTITKEKMLKAVRESHGIFRLVHKMLGCSHQHSYDLRKRWPEVDEAVNEAREQRQASLVCKAEDAIEKRIMDGDTTAIIYTLKTQGKSRNWGQSDERNTGTINLNIQDFSKLQGATEVKAIDASGDNG